MMSRRDQPTPSPEVHYLPAIFRRVRYGEIRVPAFQRGFVWDEKQVLELLESVLHGFPIGSVLLWKVDEKILKIESPLTTAFPEVAEKYPLSYILDGMQRLSTLYGVCNYSGPSEQKNKFNVVFDLSKERFVHYNQREVPSLYIRLADLFVPKRLIEAQSFMAQQDDSDRLIERLVTLHSVFQEYLVPTVTIAHRSVSDVVQIFERINNTGTTLGAVDFLRAVTWSEGFDLNGELKKIQRELDAEKYKVPDETIVKVLGIVLGRAPLPDALLTLRNLSEEELHRGIERTTEVFQRCISLLKEDFRILSYDYVPYEGQMLVLARVLHEHGELREEERAELRKWFWSTSVLEALQGRPDHYIAGLVENADTILTGQFLRQRRAPFRIEDLSMRLFTKGKALSSAIASMFALNGARSLLTGEVIPTEVYMSDFSQQHFGRILSRVELPELASDRVIANIVVVTEQDRVALSKAGGGVLADLIRKHHDEGNMEVLQSQFISSGAAKELIDGHHQRFLPCRGDELLAAAFQLTRTGTWSAGAAEDSARPGGGGLG